MKAAFGNRDSGIGRRVPTELVKLHPLDERIAGTWQRSSGGLLVRRRVSRRDFTKGAAMLVGASALSPLATGCDPNGNVDWSWVLEVVNAIVMLVDDIIGEYETRNTGMGMGEAEVTTDALSASGSMVDSVVQTFSVPNDGATYMFRTPTRAMGGLTVPDAGTYQLEGRIPVAGVTVQSSMFAVT